MKVGDLVRLKTDNYKAYGIIIEYDEGLVGVLWCGSEFVYLEPAKHLEVVNEIR